MSTNYYSYAVIGWQIPREMLLELINNTKVRNCNHSGQESHKFCNECGQPVWKEVAEYDNINDLLDKRKIPYTYDEYMNYYIGLIAEQNIYFNSKNSFIEKFDVTNIFSASRAELIGLGLDPKDFKFGLYAVLHCSY